MVDPLLFGRLADAKRARPRRFRLFNAHLDQYLSENDVKSRFRFGRHCINYLAGLLPDDLARTPLSGTLSSESMGAYHSTKKFRGKFPEISMGKWYSLFPEWKTIVVRLEFFNDF